MFMVIPERKKGSNIIRAVTFQQTNVKLPFYSNVSTPICPIRPQSFAKMPKKSVQK